MTLQRTIQEGIEEAVLQLAEAQERGDQGSVAAIVCILQALACSKDARPDIGAELEAYGIPYAALQIGVLEGQE